jgi:hypothetical protein
MRYSLRTLLILMLIGGPLTAWGWTGWQAYLRSQRTTCAPSLKQLKIAIHNYFSTPPLPACDRALEPTPAVSE